MVPRIWSKFRLGGSRMTSRTCGWRHIYVEGRFKNWDIWVTSFINVPLNNLQKSKMSSGGKGWGCLKGSRGSLCPVKMLIKLKKVALAEIHQALLSQFSSWGDFHCQSKTKTALVNFTWGEIRQGWNSAILVFDCPLSLEKLHCSKNMF